MIDNFTGARWWKFDFHTHTPASRDTPWFQLVGSEDELSQERWLLNFMSARVDCLAVTDHNTGEWIDRLKDTYTQMKDENREGFRKLAIFPGVEISVNGGFHLLAIFGPEATSDSVQNLLAKVGYDGTTGDSDGVTVKSAVEVIKIVHDCGALAIPAHVDIRKGLLELKDDGRKLVLDANTVRQVLRREEILAVEAVDPQWMKHEIILEEKCRWTETAVLGSDFDNFRNGKQPGEAFTWVKMCEPNLEGLRLALLDGSPLSIQRSDTHSGGNPNDHARLAIERIEINNLGHAGRGRPLQARFSPWLSTLIGGRGTGKSTVVELLRLVLGREHELGNSGGRDQRFEASGNFDRIKGALLENASIKVWLQKDGGRFRVTWNGDENSTIEEETEEGEWVPAPGDVASRFPVRLYSQKQVFALADRHDSLLRLVDENLGIRDWKSRREELESRFLRLRAQTRELGSRLEEKDRLAGNLEDVVRQLAVFEEGGSKELLLRYQRLRRQRNTLDSRREELTVTADLLSTTAEGIEPADIRLEDFAGDDPYLIEARNLLEEAAAKQRTVAAQLQASSRELELFQGAWWERIEQSIWSRETGEIKRQYEELVDRLRQEGVADPSAYSMLLQSRISLERRLAEIEALRERKEDFEHQARESLEAIESLRTELTEKRERFLAENLGSNPHVRMKVVPFGLEAAAAEESFRQALVREERLEADILSVDGRSGILAELYAELPDGSTSKSEDFLDRLRRVKAKVSDLHRGAEMEDRSKWFQNHVRDLQPEQLDRFKLWWPSDGLKVEYKGPDGEFVVVEKGSPGQKSAAILAFLLSHGDEPLILDQPEDDLDNHLIYDLIVDQLRNNKQRRQVIVATHNPNIVVNGDAEMVIALEQRAGQCVVLDEGTGCLQSRGVRQEVCRVMEGGRDAFKRRYRRLLEEMNDASYS